LKKGSWTSQNFLLRFVWGRFSSCPFAFLPHCWKGGKGNCLKDVFQTGVLEKRDGKWVHVQIHGSYPVDKIPEAYIKKYYKNLL